MYAIDITVNGRKVYVRNGAAGCRHAVVRPQGSAGRMSLRAVPIYRRRAKPEEQRHRAPP